MCACAAHPVLDSMCHTVAQQLWHSECQHCKAGLKRPADSLLALEKEKEQAEIVYPNAQSLAIGLLRPIHQWPQNVGLENFFVCSVFSGLCRGEAVAVKFPKISMEQGLTNSALSTLHQVGRVCCARACACVCVLACALSNVICARVH